MSYHGQLKTISCNLRELVRWADDVLAKRDDAREELIRIARNIIRESGYVVTAVHRRDGNAAADHLSKLKELFRSLMMRLRDVPELRHTGLVYNAESEYVEAVVFYTIIMESRMPSKDELGSDPVPTLQGLLDVVGELKRYALDLIKSGELAEAEALASIAEDIYEALKPLDYPDALAPGIRRKVDVARMSTESLKSLLADIKAREDLARELGKAEELLRKSIRKLDHP